MVVVHVVLHNVKSTVTAHETEEYCKEFLALAKTCKKPDGKTYIHRFTGGKNNSPEGEAEGYTHAFVCEFATIEDREYYVSQDPAKYKFVDKHEDKWNSIIVIDYTPDRFL